MTDEEQQNDSSHQGFLIREIQYMLTVFNLCPIRTLALIYR